MKRILFFLVCLALLGCIIGSVGLSVEATQTIIFDFPSITGFQGDTHKYFANLIDQKTNGRIKLILYPSGELGTQIEMMQAIQLGTLKMKMGNPGNLFSLCSDFGAFDAPFLYRDAKHAIQAVNPDTSEVMKEIADKFIKESGVRVLGAGAWLGFRALTTKDFPVYKPEDLKGKKIRVMANKSHITILEGMGAIATAIDTSELPTSLMLGVVDGQDNPVINIYDYKYGPPLQYYLMKTNHVASIQILIINEKVWQGLTPEDQIVFKEAMNETAEWSVEELDRRENEVYKKLEDLGMNIISEEDGLDLEAFRSKTVDHFNETFPEWTDYINRIKKIGEI